MGLFEEIGLFIKHFAIVATISISALGVLQPVFGAESDVATALSLSDLSVQTAMPISEDSNTRLDASPSQAPKQRRQGIFSEGQSKLIQDLSKTIDVGPTGVRLCLNIHY